MLGGDLMKYRIPPLPPLSLGLISGPEIMNSATVSIVVFGA